MANTAGSASTVAFLDPLEHSFLPGEEKRRLAEAAGGGVTAELWNEFNDRLIAEVVAMRERQRTFDAGLDDEINRYTAAYEREKSVIDRGFYDTLRAVPEDDAGTRERMWSEYGRRIGALQAQLLREVKATSTTVLHDVVLSVLPDAE